MTESGEVSLQRAPGLVAIGNFDGVHRGHQAVLSEAAREAEAQGLCLRVCTFHPHPAEVLGRAAPAQLTTVARKRELLHVIEPSAELVVVPFDAAFASKTPQEFGEYVVGAPLWAQVVMVGKNFRFGKKRAGDLAELARLGAALGFSARSHDIVGDDAGAWSSTRIRAAVADGDVEAATAMLGRPHMVRGLVVRGDARGRTLGFPTANLGEVAEAFPANGVYAVRVDLEAPDGTPSGLGVAATNVGVRPTVDGQGAPRVEVHMLDMNPDLYGRRLRVHFVARLRGEKKFSGLDALKAQLQTDVEDTRARLHPIDG